MDDNFLQFVTWVVMDGCIWSKSPNSKRIQFKLSKQRKIDELISLLERAKIPHTFRLATKSGVNKLQPYFIRVYGETALKTFNYLQGEKSFPKGWRDLTFEQFSLVVDTISKTDGWKVDRRVNWNTTDLNNVEIVSYLCDKYNIDYEVKTYKSLRSGFKENGLKQYLVTMRNFIDNKY